MQIPLNATVLVFLFLATSCAVISSLLIFQEIGEVNRKLLEEEQISYLFMYPGKMQKIKNHYMRLYPGGRVDFWRFVFQIGAFVFAACTAVTAGFFH